MGGKGNFRGEFRQGVQIDPTLRISKEYQQ